MVRLIVNVLVFGLTAILLSSCAAGVKVIDTYTIEKKREPLALADPKPLALQDIDWIIITKDNAAETFDILTTKDTDAVLFGLTDDNYEILSKNFAHIRAHIIKQRQIINQYKEYYE